MTPYAEALEILFSKIDTLGTEKVPIAQLSGRVLAKPVIAPIDLPPFDNSAVDGYGVHAKTFEKDGAQIVTGEVAAGDDPTQQEIQKNQAIRLFTGSAIPKGVNAVVMQEDVTVSGNHLAPQGQIEKGDHIRKQGAELKSGNVAHPAHALITPPLLGLIASLGISQAEVYRRPTVAILGTGNELVSPGNPLGPGQVYEANSYAVRAAVESMGLTVISCDIVRDNVESTRTALAKALEADVVITCGGVSVGDHDLVRESLALLDVKEELWRVAIKPGKPFYFGIGPNGQKVFGLPGNPVSALVTFGVLVRPALRSMLGLPPFEGNNFPLGLGQELPATQNRAEFVRASMKDGKAYPLRAQGSHMLSGLAGADVLLHLPPHSGPYRPGDEVSAIPLRWS